MDFSLGALRSASFAMLASASSGSRAYFPVSPVHYIYSQFEYVAGTPADDGIGIPLTKLKILNTLIDQLLAMTGPSGGEGLKFLAEGAGEEEIAAMIARAQKEVQTISNAMQDAPYRPPSPEVGLLFNIDA